MEQLITTRTLRRYTVKFHFGNCDPSFRNRNVVKWEMNVTGYSVTGATRKAEMQMCNIGFIRRGGNIRRTSRCNVRVGNPSQKNQMDLNCYG